MKRSKITSARSVNPLPIEYERKPMTACGSVAALAAKFLCAIGFREWIKQAILVAETSPNARGVHEKALAQFLTVLCGGAPRDGASGANNGRLEPLEETAALRRPEDS